MNVKNKTRKNDENIIIMRCELLTSNLVAYHKKCTGVDVTAFQYISKKPNFTGISKLGVYQS